MAVGGGGRWWAVEKWTDFRHETTVPVKQKRFMGQADRNVRATLNSGAFHSKVARSRRERMPKE
jgi:hypothetical protein